MFLLWCFTDWFKELCSRRTISFFTTVVPVVRVWYQKKNWFNIPPVGLLLTVLRRWFYCCSFFVRLCVYSLRGCFHVLSCSLFIVIFSGICLALGSSCWKERAGCFAFLCFVACVLSVEVCLRFFLVSLLGYDLWLWLFLGPVVQSVASLTSSLRVISLTVLVDSIYNILIFLLKKCE